MTPTEILKSLEHLTPTPIPCHAAAHMLPGTVVSDLDRRIVELTHSVPVKFEWVRLDMIPGLLSFNPEYVAISIRPFDAKFDRVTGGVHRPYDWGKPRVDGEEFENKRSWDWPFKPPITEYLDWVGKRATALQEELGNQKVIFLLGHETWTPHPVATHWLNEVVAILRVVFPDAEFAWAHWGRKDNRFVSRGVYSDYGVAHFYYPPGSTKNQQRWSDAANAVRQFNVVQGPGARTMKVMARVVPGGCYEERPFVLRGEDDRSAFPNAPVGFGQTWGLGERLTAVDAVTFWPGIGDDRLTDTWEHLKYFIEGMTGIRHPVEE